MPEFRITRRSALGDASPILRGSVSIEALQEGHVLHVLADRGEQNLSAVLADFTGNKAYAVRPVTQSQWFVVGDSVITQSELGALSAAIGAEADLIDQSDGRVRFKIRGPMAKSVLEKGTAVDLELSEFPIGRSATTLLGHISVHITRLGGHEFELIVLRSFAESLWDELARMSHEFS
ncbi:sarcosine oxidase subunit gamma family protein [Rhizobium sp. YTU87027]|uniref:sarcosine oxidase subunit gamma family protein n=1 Tax=Rhizobium sp. YTU87027 TaxID=3417741 RepID=UPI003D694C7A